MSNHRLRYIVLAFALMAFGLTTVRAAVSFAMARQSSGKPAGAAHAARNMADRRALPLAAESFAMNEATAARLRAVTVSQ